VNINYAIVNDNPHSPDSATDFTLVEGHGSAWLRVDGIALYIRRLDDGTVRVSMHNADDCDGPTLAEMEACEVAKEEAGIRDDVMTLGDFIEE